VQAEPTEIRNYLTPDGKSPYENWFNSLRDNKGKAKIRIRLGRIMAGNMGDYRSVGSGVFEFKIDYGPGYRIYFGRLGLTIVLLLCGGDKDSQKRDIRKAKEYWQDYESRTNSDQ